MTWTELSMGRYALMIESNTLVLYSFDQKYIIHVNGDRMARFVENRFYMLPGVFLKYHI